MREKKNAYVCQSCGHTTITINIDEGTTPMMISCRECGGMAYSKWYRIDQSLPASHEWYYPTVKIIWQLIDVELSKLKKQLRKHPRSFKKRSKYIRAGFLDHWKHGGLFLRPIHNLLNIDFE